jgi:Spy/CpxP family protein refolding chaperone
MPLLMTASAYGYFGGEVYYKWWKNPKIAEEMKLTEDQADEIENIFTSYKEEIIVHQKELRQRESELLSKLREPKCSREEVMLVTDDIENIKAALTRIKVDMFLKIKNILTPEQEEALHNIRARYREKKIKEMRELREMRQGETAQ